MARNKFFTDVDLTGNQLKNGKPHHVTGTPPVDDQSPWTNITGQDLSASPADGQLAYETISKTLLVYKTANSTIPESGWYTAGGDGQDEQVQADWTQTDDTQPDYIKNKPDIEPFIINYVGEGTTGYQKTIDKTAEQIYNAVQEGRVIKFKFSTSIYIFNPVICEKSNDNTYKIVFVSIDLRSHSTVSTNSTNISDSVAFVSNAGSFNADWVAADNVYLSTRIDVNKINNGTLNLQKNGEQVAQFTANSASDVTANITVPTQLSDLTNNIDWYGTQAEFEALQDYSEELKYHIETPPTVPSFFKTYEKIIRYCPPEPFYIMPLDNNGGVSITMGEEYALDINLQYSLDKNTWENISLEPGETYDFASAANQKIYLRATPTATTFPLYKWRFGASTQYKVGGHLLSMLDATAWMTDNTMQYGQDKFFELFANESNLIDASELILADNCQYTCYHSMFENCTNLIGAPILPATTMEPGCYQGMFYGCTSLETAPDLPATTLVHYCYNNMFGGCTSLNSIKCLATSISATQCTTNMTDGVSANGTFYKDTNMLDWTTGVDGIPSGWTVVDV